MRVAKIQVLDKQTIDQIAAGEVIERPSSVVKELVENAIDAGSTAVTVEVKEGGTSLIRITDNGCGIEKSQVATAFLRHSTSKIRSALDLVTVSSLGFRGEALSSIASVAQVELITKTGDAPSGTRYVIEGGEEKELEEIGAPDGTTFLVRNLFYNTPARKKFLKAPMTEAGYINDLINRLALSHPEISFKFINNGQSKLHTSGNTNLKDVIYQVYGREITSNLIEVEGASGPIKVKGFIGKPAVSRGNRNYETYFINGRYIKSTIISKGIEDAYKTFMMQHKFPFAVLHFTMEGDMLDVNVHPTKMELRFSNQEEIYRFVQETLKEGLTKPELIPKVSFGTDTVPKKQEAVKPDSKPRAQVSETPGLPFNSAAPERPSAPAASARQSAASEPVRPTAPAVPDDKMELKEMQSPSAPAPAAKQQAPAPEKRDTPEDKDLSYFMEEMKKRVSAYHSKAEKEEPPVWEAQTMEEAPVYHAKSETEEQLTLFEEKLLTPEARERHRLIGQLFETYWLVEFNEQLYIIDQHAAHEKVLYERTMKSLNDKEFTSQLLNPPIVLTLSMQEEQLLNRYMDEFTAVGFEISPFGGKEYAVQAVPDNLFGLAKKELLLEMLDDLSSGVGSHTPEIVREKIASMSCKAAVKGNQTLTFKEAGELIDELLTLENPYNCPHGRPTIISMTKYELEKKFKRIV